MAGYAHHRVTSPDPPRGVRRPQAAGPAAQAAAGGVRRPPGGLRPEHDHPRTHRPPNRRDELPRLPPAHQPAGGSASSGSTPSGGTGKRSGFPSLTGPRVAVKPVDASATYETPAGEVVNFAGAADLSRFVADSPDAHAAFVGRLFRHAVKQPCAAFGLETQAELAAAFEDVRHGRAGRVRRRRRDRRPRPRPRRVGERRPREDGLELTPTERNRRESCSFDTFASCPHARPTSPMTPAHRPPPRLPEGPRGLRRGRPVRAAAPQPRVLERRVRRGSRPAAGEAAGRDLQSQRRRPEDVLAGGVGRR